MRWRPMRRLGRSLQVNLFGLSLLPALLLTSLGGGYFLYQQARDGQAQLRQNGSQLARQLAAAADYGIFSGNSSALRRLVESVTAEPGVVFAAVIDEQGAALVQDVSADGPVAAHWRQVAATGRLSAPQATLLVAEAVGVASGDEVIFVQPVASPPLEVSDFSEPAAAALTRAPPRGWVVVVMTTRPITEALYRITAGVVVAVVLAMAMAALFARRLARRISSPLRALASAVAQVGSGEPVQVKPTRITVISDLADGFNRMAQQIDSATRTLEDKVREATVGWREQTFLAQDANQAKTRFLAAASHDLRQPMHALSMFIAALRQETDPARCAELLLKVETSVLTMAGLLDALLDISKLDAGRIEPRLEKLPLQPVLDTLYDQYAGLAQEQGIALAVRHSPLWVETDPLMLGRILGNFVSNAIRYTPGGSERPANILVAVRRRGEGVCVEVRDNGIGIPLGSQQAIFQEFVQLQNSQRDRGKGLGLGLAIVQRLAALLGHQISVRSAPGAGSTFSVCLPLSEPVAAPAPGTGAVGPSGEAASLEGARVLVVEDDELVRDSAEQLMRLWGCEVRAFEHGQGLASALREQGWCPHVIVCDFRLGNDTDGLAVIQSVRRAWGQAIPAFIISGDTELGLDERVRGEDVAVLYKPIRPPALRLALVEAVKGVSVTASA